MLGASWRLGSHGVYTFACHTVELRLTLSQPQEFLVPDMHKNQYGGTGGVAVDVPPFPGSDFGRCQLALWSRGFESCKNH